MATYLREKTNVGSYYSIEEPTRDEKRRKRIEDSRADFGEEAYQAAMARFLAEADTGVENTTSIELLRTITARRDELKGPAAETRAAQVAVAVELLNVDPKELPPLTAEEEAVTKNKLDNPVHKQLAAVQKASGASWAALKVWCEAEPVQMVNDNGRKVNKKVKGEIRVHPAYVKQLNLIIERNSRDGISNDDESDAA